MGIFSENMYARNAYAQPVKPPGILQIEQKRKIWIKKLNIEYKKAVNCLMQKEDDKTR